MGKNHTHKLTENERNVSNILILMWLRNDAVGNWYNDTLRYRRDVQQRKHERKRKITEKRTENCLAHEIMNDCNVTSNKFQRNQRYKTMTNTTTVRALFFSKLCDTWLNGRYFSIDSVVQNPGGKKKKETKWCVSQWNDTSVVFDTLITMIACLSYKIIWLL